jgi:hypothetical protein
MPEVSREFISIEAISPSILYYFFFENGIGWIVLSIGSWVSAGVVIKNVEGGPETDASEKGTISHHNYEINDNL